MTGLEAIPKISELLARLINLSKDRETALLIQQIQEHQLIVHKELMQAHARIAELEKEKADRNTPTVGGFGGTYEDLSTE